MKLQVADGVGPVAQWNVAEGAAALGRH